MGNLNNSCNSVEVVRYRLKNNMANKRFKKTKVSGIILRLALTFA